MASRRQYTTIAEVEEFADVTSTNDSEFEDQISMAEEMIDSYVGYQDKHLKREYFGILTSVDGTTLYDTSSDGHFDIDDDYFTYAWIEIIGGAGKGQRARIVSSDKSAKSVTISSAFSTTPDNTSAYKIWQLGKFPRRQDVETMLQADNTNKVYKNIPEAVRRAVAAQVEFVIQMGAEYFAGDQSDKESESIGNYSYSKGSSGAGSSNVRLISPKARQLLRGVKNIKGKLIG